ncbi:MAG: maltose alpha-D-glucosyltransferase, partial [Planctomycetota bacterium]
MATVTTSSTARTRAKKRGSAVYVGPTPQDWYKDAVIYEVHVRAFQDSNGDGIGDFRGLTSRLDYLQDLGVTAVWVLPFYPSPLRDDGYDIADYTSVNPSYGSMADVRRFVTEAHKRDIKVITELVINHTSDQHPWFQRARRAPAGSSHRDFYVWSDTPDKYPGVRIIFQDTETSNWTYDQVAGQYYWHRFFGHQPDLNFDNPAVLKAVKKVMDFWFEIGVDGMRLDAVPYLIERDGTNCENLPETHEILKDLRRHLDDRWPGRMFLAEANQWPEDAIAYYGVREAEGALGSSDDAVRVGDECHMNFHFPLMPRLFMSLRMEDRFPIVDILQQTPAIPDNCQWAMFLRNHDELTLEMVTDEERDYMYKAYARDRQMRINVGIRRRLSPLLEHDRRKIELMNGLLMSMPGTPVLYYGDEIGMGDNVYLGDRDAVRTPMQWSSDRNAGFSKSNPQQLYLPVIIEPGSHFENVNVESQQENASSLLWWMKRLIAIRKSRPVLARGEMEFLQPENSKVVAFLRTGMEANDGQGEHDMLVVANLSRFSQPVELDLAQYEGRTPVEVFGLTRFPQIGELPYLLTMGPHSFYWFSLERPEGEAGEEDEAPTVEIGTDASSWLRGAGLTRWASRALPGILPKQRWFSSKARTIREVAVADTVPLGRDGRSDEAGLIDSALCAVRVSFTEGDDETYLIPLVLIDAERALRQTGVQPANTMAVLKHRESGVRTVLADGSGDESFWRELHGLIARRRAVRGRGGDLVGLRVPGSGTAPS